MSNTRSVPVDPISAISAQLDGSSAGDLTEGIGAVQAKYGPKAADMLRDALKSNDVQKAEDFARQVLGKFYPLVVESDDNAATIFADGAVVKAHRQSPDGVAPLVSAIITAAGNEIRRRAEEPKTYDPLAATVYLLGLPQGETFFMENLDFMREIYGDEITDALRSAYTENDLAKAEEFAALLVDDFTYEVDSDDDESLSVSYSAAGGVEGLLTMKRSPHRDETDLLVLAVLNASEGIFTRARIKAKVDAEIAAEEAATRRP
jgi:hypothetical protein